MNVEIIKKDGTSSCWDSPVNSTGHVRGWRVSWQPIGLTIALVVERQKVEYQWGLVREIPVNYSDGVSFDAFWSEADSTLTTEDDFVFDAETRKLKFVKVHEDKWEIDQVLLRTNSGNQREALKGLNEKYRQILQNGRPIWECDEIKEQRLKRRQKAES